jgi:hypothetical protein
VHLQRQPTKVAEPLLAQSLQLAQVIAQLPALAVALAGSLP